MKTITQAFTDALTQPNIKVARQVYYKRRYWTGSAYAWESSWTLLSETGIVSVSPLTSQLDTETQNEFSISNLTLVLDNLKKQYKPDNLSGFFAPDGVSSVGYEPFWTKFQLRAGLLYANGTSEILTLFTGVATELNFQSKQGTVQITVSGLQDTLLKANAQAVANVVTNEAVGTGDGSTKIFSTANKGVGNITSVTVAGVVKTLGTDYNIDSLGDVTAFATITFVLAPASSAAIKANYYYWYQGQKFETLVSALLTQAGVPSPNQFVNPVVFASSITNIKTFQTEADWETGTLSNALTALFPNTIHGDFAGARTSQTWGSSTSGWTTAGQTNAFGDVGAWSSSGGNLVYGGGSHNTLFGSAYRANTIAVGTWEWVCSTQTAVGHWMFFAGNVASFTPSGGGTGALAVGINGYGIQTSGSTITLMRYGASAIDPVSGTSIGSGSATLTGTPTITVTRFPTGLMVVSVNGSVVITATDTTFTTTNYFTTYQTSSPGTTGRSAGSYVSPSSSVFCSWVSPTFDSSATPTAWLQVVINDTPLTSTFAYLTRSSADGTTWDSWISLPSSKLVQSTLRRYFQIQWNGTILTDGTDPFLTSMTIGSITSSTLITMADFTQLTVYDAITQIAAMANYEFGFDSSENFFFRAKKLTSTPAMTLDHTNFLCDILSLVQGYDLVSSGVAATYGSYTSEVDDPGGSRLAPLARFGYALYQPSSGSFLTPSDASLAANIAQNLFNYYQLPRRRVKAATKFLPQIDLSDVVQLSFLDNEGNAQWFWGDTAVYWGDTKIYYQDSTSLGDISNFIGKVIGYRVDTDNWSCEMDLEEVI